MIRLMHWVRTIIQSCSLRTWGAIPRGVLGTPVLILFYLLLCRLGDTELGVPRLVA